MSIGEDQTECPLCMEPLEMDDINFFPCTCGYQICRFCWHRIRTDENGLCPACRKAYPEDPAEFKPLTEDELQRIKKERRQKEAQRKQKAAENRKHLANVRVVQKNLVFVVGLSQRLADPEVLKKHEYFGKFGKIHKVVINQSTSYAGAQGPSASAYVTYHRPEDALKAIQAVNNIHVDGRTLKASLGTTKYCSHFLRGAQCPKPDCMYLHELGEEAASFTKEEMQQGKHQEYEQKLCEQFLNCQNVTTTSANPQVSKPQTRKKTSSPVLSQTPVAPPAPPAPSGHTPPPQTTKEAWPSLQTQSANSVLPGTTKPERLTNGNKAPPSNNSFTNGNNGSHSQNISSKPETQNAQNRAPGYHRNNGQHTEINTTSKQNAPSPDLSPVGSSSSGDSISPNSSTNPQQMNSRGGMPPLSLSPHQPSSTANLHTQPLSSSQAPFTVRSSLPTAPPGLISAAVAAAVQRKLPFQSATDSMSLFSSANGFPTSRNPKPAQHIHHPDDTLPAAAEIPETIPVGTSTDWQAAFGFSSSQSDSHDDDLGFDPWNESAKALAEIIERESITNDHKLPFNPITNPHPAHPHTQQYQQHPQHQQQHQLHQDSLSGHLPVPQLMSNMHQITQLLDNRPKTLPPGFNPNHIGAPTNNQMAPPGSKIMNLMHLSSVPGNQHNHTTQHNPNTYHNLGHNELHMPAKRDTISPQDWQDGLRALLPNINISFGAPPLGSNNDERRNIDRSPQQPPQPTAPHQAHNKHHSEEIPHWMASLHHLTEDTTQAPPMPNSANSHQGSMMPPSSHMPFRNSAPSWPPQSMPGATHPPPGFHNAQLRPQAQPEVSQLADGFQ